MKTIKKAFITLAAIPALQMAVSCNSCSREEDKTKGQDTSVASHDTVYIDTCMGTNDSLIREGATGNYIRVNRVNPQSGTSGGGTKGSNTGTATSGGKQLSQDEIDARIENSSSQAYKNGKPVNSGGTSGTGQGTGTGSTGNNSRVTTKEDQLRN